MDFRGAINRIEELKKERKEFSEILDMYQNILEFQQASAGKVELDVRKLPLSLAVEKPLIKVLKDYIDEDVIYKLVSNFLEFLLVFGTQEMKEEAKRAAEGSAFTRENIKEILTDFLEKEQVVPGSPPLFINMVVLSVAPILFSPMSKILQEQLPEDFESVNCPYCGSKAAVGYLKKSKEGKRYLVCPVCYGEWPIKRDRCAYCGNEDLEEHFYLLPESKNDSYVRIDICDKCKRYIKTIDERVLDEKGKKCFPLVEDIATPHLDVKAAEEGYTKVNVNIFGF